MKKFVYKVYDNKEVFISTLPKVLNEPQFTSYINGGLGELTIKLQRSIFEFEESTVVANGNIVEVICFDDDAPTGVKIYSGTISKYNLSKKQGEEVITITCLGSIADFEKYITVFAESEVFKTKKRYTSAYYWDTGRAMKDLLCRYNAQGGRINGKHHTRSTGSDTDSTPYFASGTSADFEEAEMTFSFWVDFSTVTLSNQILFSHYNWCFYQDSSDKIRLRIEYDSGGSNVEVITTTVFTTGTWYNITGTYSEENNEIKIYVNGVLEATTSLATHTIYKTSGTDLKMVSDTHSWKTSFVGNLADPRIYETILSDLQVKNIYEEDPPNKNMLFWCPILEKVAGTGAGYLEDYVNGNGFTYPSGVDPISTNTPFSETVEETSDDIDYTINSLITREAIDKMNELAPVGWFFFVGADNNLIFKEKETDADHLVTLGKDVLVLDQDKSIENMVNCIYFTGGYDSVTEDNFYRVYKRTGSIDSYGLFTKKIVDTQVQDTDTMDIMMNAILDRYDTPEVKTILEIRDNNGDDDRGLDIESIKPGDTIKLLGFGSKATNKWDEAIWDTDKWDYDTSTVSSTVQQIQKVTYHPDKVTVEISTRLPDVARSIKKLADNQINQTTNDNPTTPTAV